MTDTHKPAEAPKPATHPKVYGLKEWYCAATIATPVAYPKAIVNAKDEAEALQAYSKANGVTDCVWGSPCMVCEAVKGHDATVMIDCEGNVVEEIAQPVSVPQDEGTGMDTCDQDAATKSKAHKK
jgi:hypothetical protein